MSTSRRRQVQHPVRYQGKQQRWTPRDWSCKIIVANNQTLLYSIVTIVAGSHLKLLLWTLIQTNQNPTFPSASNSTGQRECSQYKASVQGLSTEIPRIKSKKTKHALTSKRFCDVTCCPNMQRSQKGPINAVLLFCHIKLPFIADSSLRRIPLSAAA